MKRMTTMIFAGLICLAIPAAACAWDGTIVISNECPGMVVWAEMDGKPVTRKLRLNQALRYRIRTSGDMKFLYADQETPDEVLGSQGPLSVDPDDCEARATMRGPSPGSCGLLLKRDGMFGHCY